MFPLYAGMGQSDTHQPSVVIGGGMGGLIAAIELAAAGHSVQLFEQAASVGGKLRVQYTDGQAVDAGPTVFTLADVFDASLARAGTCLADEISYQPADVLARHIWPDGSRLDLFADRQRSLEAVSAFAGARAADQFAGFLRASTRAARLLDGPFMREPRPGIARLMRRHGPSGWLDMARLNPFTSLWRALGQHFDDPRLRQLFARYATYTGSDPFQASASLMLIAHVEQAGVWQINGGMIELARALARVARRLGVVIETGQTVTELEIAGGRIQGLHLADERYIASSHVVFNGDARALADGTLGAAARRAVHRRIATDAGLSGVTWVCRRRLASDDLTHHNVLFNADYRAEFNDIFGQGRLPRDPTIYLCAQDRPAVDHVSELGAERLLCLVNAPPAVTPLDPGALSALTERVDARLAAHGLALELARPDVVRTDPAAFARAFPGSRGALYGHAAHGWRAPFQRPTARSKIHGLYLAGGSCHPGAGLPMAALSGQHAARALLEDHAST